MSEATTNGLSINGNQHSYSDAYVNKKDTANVNGNDSGITTAALSNGVPGNRNRSFEDIRGSWVCFEFNLRCCFLLK